jgi:hypothetical protein
MPQSLHLSQVLAPALVSGQPPAFSRSAALPFRVRTIGQLEKPSVRKRLPPGPILGVLCESEGGQFIHKIGVVTTSRVTG